MKQENNGEPLKNKCDKMNQKGQFSYFIYFIVVMVVFLPIILFAFPTLQAVAIGFAGGTEGFISANYTVIEGIDNAELKADYNALINEQFDSQSTRISILNDAIVFGAIFIVVIVFIGIYLLARRNIEVGSMG